MLFDRSLVIVSGKGGAGRSAVAAALARVAALDGRRVLALAMAGADGLTAHLAAEPLTEVPEDAGGGVMAARVDPGAALDEYVRLRIGPVPHRLAGRIFSALASTVPGVRDIIIMGKCVHEATSGRWDLVVVDGYPTGQIESVLGAPGSIAELVGRGPVHEQAVGLLAQLSDPRITSLAVVATPEELALTEASDLTAQAAALGLPAPDLVVNHVIDPPGFAEPPPEPGPVRDAALLSLGLVERQQTLLASERPRVLLPHVFGAAEPQSVTRHLMEAME